MRAAVAAAALALSGCLAQVGPDYSPPAVEAPPAWAGPVAPPAGAAATAEWWRGFRDPLLDELMQLALARNLDVGAAAARIEEARALVDVARAGGGPTLDAGTDVGGDALIAGERRSGGTAGSDAEADAGASLGFSWMPDLFGGRARAVERAEAELLQRVLLRDDAARTAAADVARRYLEIRRDQEKTALIEASLTLQRETLRLVRQRFEAGLAARLDVSRAEAQVAATQARRGELRRAIGDAGAALAVLTGAAPGDRLADGGRGIPAHAGGPPLGLPRDLLRNRPDVRAAEAALAAATAGIGVAEADLYPRLTLPGTLGAGIGGIGSGEIFEQVIASLSAGLDIPLLDAGGRRARVAAAEARAQEALLLYRRALLGALAEVEAALEALAASEARLADLQDAVEASTAAFRQAEDLYARGLVGFLDVLDAERTLLENRQDLADARAAVGLAVTDLYAAVGAPPEPPPVVQVRGARDEAGGHAGDRALPVGPLPPDAEHQGEEQAGTERRCPAA